MIFIKNKIKILFLVLIIISLTIIFNSNKEAYHNSIAVYLDNIESTSIPDRNSNYVIDKVVCDNDTIGTWNYINWGLQISNISKRSNCKLYFVTKDEITIANTSIKINEYNKCTDINKNGSVTIKKAENEDGHICKAPDDDGLSYYFRGNVQNNYVYFAGFYWRIIRINGDDSIRMIYDGTTAHENSEVSDDRIIGNSAFNEKSDDNAYIGYMYGMPNSLTYEDTHANINSSTVKTFIDNWYKNNLEGTTYEQYLVDTIFYNDRTLASKSTDSTYNNLGYAQNNTLYRWYYGSWVSTNGVNDAMKLTCQNINDKFSVLNHNKALKYPIGLLNEDEVLLAGGWTTQNNKYYLYAGSSYWTMTPYIFDNNSGSLVRFLAKDGTAHVAGNTRSTMGVKPVINIKKTTLQFGDGTTSNPYRIDKEL